MKIGRHNYEAFFLDYHEGSLSPDKMREVLAFLAANPQLKEEFDSYAVDRFDPDTRISFPEKEVLKKNMMDYNPLEEKIIAFIEGDLGEAETMAISAEINASTSSGKLYEQYLSARLVPDTSIKLPQAGALKKNLPVTAFWNNRWVMAAAASIIIIIGISTLLMLQPAGSGERETYTLTSIDRVQLKHIESAPRQVSMETRIVVAQTETSESREERILAEMPVNGNVKVEGFPVYYTMNTAIMQRIPQPLPYFPDDNTSEALADGSDDRTLAGKVLNGFFNTLTSPFSNDQKNIRESKRNITFWDIAEFGVKSINVLGDHDYTLVKEYNDKGNVKGVMLLEE